jgi:hypothetical protein
LCWLVNGALRIAGRQGFERCFLLDHLVAIHHHARHHIVRVGNAEVFVEAVIRGQVRVQMAQMPLADTARGIAVVLQMPRDGDLIRGQPGGVPWEEYAGHSRPGILAAREQSRARWRTHGIAGVEICEAEPVFRQRIDMRRPDGGTVAADIAIAQVVAIDHHEVGLTLLRGRSCGQQSSSRGCS